MKKKGLLWKFLVNLNGFELVADDPITFNFDFMNNDGVIKDYYPACEALLAKNTGGKVFAFDHNIRSATGKKNRCDSRPSKLHLVGGQQGGCLPGTLRRVLRHPTYVDEVQSICQIG